MGKGTPNTGQSRLTVLVKRLRLHSVLTEADAAAIEALPHTVKHLRPNAQLAWQGLDTSSCAVVLSGYVHRYRVTDSGLRQIVSVYVPGDPIDFDHLYLPVADDGLQTLKETTVAYIRHEDLRELMAKQAHVADAIVRSLLVDASIFREWVLNVGRREAKARIAHLLCEIAVRLEAQGFDFANAPLPLTQDQIADATGLTAVHVNRTLKGLSSERAIQRKGGLVMLPDSTILKRIAGFDEGYLHHSF